MAEVITRINGVPEPSVDIEFTDEWTDPNVRTVDPDISFAYSALTTTAPVDPGCAGVDAWTSLCRTVVNYETHIHPLWGVDRSGIDGNGIAFDHTCTGCHSPADAMGMAMVPEGQLDLTDGPSPDEPDHFNSYRELLFPDNQQTLNDDMTAVIDFMEQAVDGNGNLVFLTDGNGDLILDIDGNPIPVMVPVVLAPPMSVAGANASPRFFDLFAPGGSHEDRLNGAELKLISEWIDIGGQYYNDPFAVPP